MALYDTKVKQNRHKTKDCAKNVSFFVYIPIKLCHRCSLDGIDDVDAGLHGLGRD